MTKAVRLLEEEGYNDKCLNPMRKIIKKLRKQLGVQRVKTDTEEKVVYRPQISFEKIEEVLKKNGMGYSDGRSCLYNFTGYATSESIRELTRAIKEAIDGNDG
jgi:hypothetical protein